MGGAQRELNKVASPQKENGYTSISNEIIEHLVLPGINGSEFRVLLFILRKSYGFQKKGDVISLTQFQKNTLLNRANVVRTIKSLVAKRLLLREKSAYKFNKNWEQWVVAKRQGSSQKDNLGSSQLATYKRNITKEKTLASLVIDDLNKKTMKKNTMGSYREDGSSDSYETVINADTGEIDTTPKSNAAKSMKDLLTWLEVRRGSKFVNLGKQYKAMGQMKRAGKTPSDIKNRISDLEKDDFYKKKGFDFMDIANSFDKK